MHSVKGYGKVKKRIEHGLAALCLFLGERLMFKIGFDNEKYLNMQSEHIAERIRQFGGKL